MYAYKLGLRQFFYLAKTVLNSWTLNYFLQHGQASDHQADLQTAYKSALKMEIPIIINFE